MSAPPTPTGGPKKVPSPGGKAPPGGGAPAQKKKMGAGTPSSKSPVMGKSPAGAKSPVSGAGSKSGTPVGPKKAPSPAPSDGAPGPAPPVGKKTSFAGKKAPLPPTARPLSSASDEAPEGGTPGTPTPAPAAPPATAPGTKTPTKSKSPMPPSAGAKSPMPAAAGKKSPMPGTAGKKSPMGGMPPTGKKSPMPPMAGKKSPLMGGKSPTPNVSGKQSPMPGGMPPIGKKMAPPGKGMPPMGKKGPGPPSGSRGPTPGSRPDSPPPAGNDDDVANLPPPDETPPDSPREQGADTPRGGRTPPPGATTPDRRQRDNDLSGISPIPANAMATMGGASPGATSMGLGSNNSAMGQQPPLQPSMSAAYGAPNAEYLTPAQAARRKLMAARRVNNQQSARKSAGPLTVDPRSALPIIEFPKERSHIFSNFGSDLILHIFLECDRISSKGKNLRRVVFVTDQTLFLCEEDGGLMRCVQVSKISFINKANDSSNEVALVIPSEYDLILRMDRKQERDDFLKVLSAVYLRMVSTELNIQTVKEIPPNQYHMDKPAGYQLQRIPQRSRANLQKSLATIEEQQEERNQAILSVQSALEQEHRQQTLNKKGEIERMQEKLDEATSRQKQQQEELEKLRAAFAKCKKRREEIDSQLGAQGQTPMNKDAKLKELAEVVEALTASVQKASEERQRMEAIRRAGDFEVRELDDIHEDIPRLRGRSLHHQGLIEVLQRQVGDKNKEIAELSKRQMELQSRQIELKRKQDQLKELEQSLPSYGSGKANASQFAILGGPTAAEMLDGPGADSSYIRASGDGGRTAMRSGYGEAAYTVPPRYQDPTVSFGASSAAAGGLNDSKMFSSPTKAANNDARELDVPNTLEEFLEDPRTGLPFVTVQKREQFRWLYDSVLFFFEECSKINKRGRVEKRIMFVTDRELALCNDQGKIRRQILITDIERITIDENFNVVIHPTDLKGEHELLVRFKQQKDVELLVKVLRNCGQFLGRNMTVTKIPHIQQTNYRLEKLANYEGKIDFAAQKRSDLYKIVLGAKNRRAKEQLSRDAVQKSEDREAADRIREDLKGEMALRHEREHLQLRQQLNAMDQNLRDKQNEIRLLHKKIENHKCVVVGSSAVANQQQAMDLFETHGIYWIPTDPVVMECTMEILHVMFYDNFVVTSHPNGFINVWQISDASLYRTLKTNGHTARVTAFHFDGHDLISGGHDSSIRKWSITEGLCVRAIHHAHNGPVTGVQFDAFKCVTSGGDGVLNVWDTSSLKKKKTLTGHRSGVVCFKFEGNTLASADWGWIFVWDVDRGLVLKTLRDDNGGILSLDLSGVTLLTGGAGGVLTVWNLNTSESEQLDGHTDDIHCVQLQNNFAVSSSSDGSIQMWQVRTMVSLGVFHSCVPLECKRFHFKANRFVVGEGNTIKVWTR